jgi:hypothetical protein
MSNGLVNDFPLTLLKPVDLACLQVLRRFWHVARRGKGGRIIDGVPWIRVTAADMVGYFAREGVSVSEVTVSRSLRRLELASRCRRKQLFLSRWDHRYWYAPSSWDGQNDHSGESENDLPLEISQSNQKSKTVSPILADQWEDPESSVQPLEGINPVLSGVQEAQGALSLSMDGEIHRSNVLVACEGSWRPQQDDAGTGSVWQRVRALAAQFDPSKLETVSPRVVVVGGQVLRVDDGATSPLR